jgi:hypothetical protein
MKRILILCAVLVFIAVSAFPSMADSRGRIHGRVITFDGDEFEGLIRWDKNEASWIDMIDCTKELSLSKRRGRDKEEVKSIYIFGVRVGKVRTKGGRNITSAMCQVAFGHLAAIEFTEDDEALLIFKSGEELVVKASSTDIGDNNRGIVVEDPDRGDIDLEWEDIERIDFSQGGYDIRSSFGDRLYGTLTTRKGDTFTGWVCWDADEVLTGDILDGEHRGRDREIPFGKIMSIERRSSSSARVTLLNGDRLTLKGTNDVDSSNRGISIFVEDFGVVKVDWDDFDRLDFDDPPAPVGYDSFDGGRMLRGSVYTDSGEKYTGYIRWDDDEEYTWEVIDTKFKGVEMDIELGNISSIRRKGCCSAIITLWDGHEFKVKGSNDVDNDNKGIFVILDSGEEIEVDWDDFDYVDFKN